MQIVETSSEGLKRAYTLTIDAKDIEARIDREIKRIAPQVRMPGFRPGKVPANLVKKMHGEALHADVLNTTIRESVDGLISGRQLRPALQPKVELSEGYEPGKNAELAIELEVLPDIVEAVGGHMAIIIDGGFRRGSDVVKALALGANMAFLGRVPLYGAVAGGEAGVLRALNIVRSEIDRVLALIGCPDVARLTPEWLVLGERGHLLTEGGSAAQSTIAMIA